MPVLAAKISEIKIEKKVTDDTLQNIYSVHRQLFFASVQDFTIEFEDVKVTKLKQKQVDFGLIGLDASSIRLLDSLSIPYAK